MKAQPQSCTQHHANSAWGLGAVSLLGSASLWPDLTGDGLSLGHVELKTVRFRIGFCLARGAWGCVGKPTQKQNFGEPREPHEGGGGSRNSPGLRVRQSSSPPWG